MPFRAKKVSDGTWIEGFYVERDNKTVIYPTGKQIIRKALARELRPQHSAKSTQKCMREIFPVDPDTVVEYTGLRDKNGRRIFEGDIVDGLFRSATPLRAVCAFKDGAFGLAWTHGGVDYFSVFAAICNVEYEVVGNIYDNPELLEQEVQ